LKEDVINLAVPTPRSTQLWERAVLIDDSFEDGDNKYGMAEKVMGLVAPAKRVSGIATSYGRRS